jgi:cardiolipin synthase
MVIDGKIGYMGSACIAKRMENWRDTYMRFSGALVKEMMFAFGITEDGCLVENKKEKLDHNFRDDGFNFQLNTPHMYRNPVYDDLLHHINNATQTIYMVTPYFIAPRKLVQALFAARERGVKVSIMASHETDVKMADLAARSEYHKYIEKGINIYLYKPSVIHSKYAFIDDKWATMGSTNIDYLSLHKNKESNVAITRKDVVSQLKDHFTEDLKSCYKIDGEFLQKRPLKERLAGHFARFLKKFL